MFTFEIIMHIIIAHWIADFILQSHWMATNKSTNNIALLYHVLVYTLYMTVAVLGIVIVTKSTVLYTTVLLWGIINGMLHFITDWITSRCSSYLYKRGDIHNFFVVIGFDQVIHYACLFVTLKYII